jgi:hypothetical protein
MKSSFAAIILTVVNALCGPVRAEPPPCGADACGTFPVLTVVVEMLPGPVRGEEATRGVNTNARGTCSIHPSKNNSPNVLDIVADDAMGTAESSRRFVG